MTFWELGNSVLRDLEGSALTEIELVSACWEEWVSSLGEGETRGIWAVGKKSLLEEVTELDKEGKWSLWGYLSSLKITSLETYNFLLGERHL